MQREEQNWCIVLSPIPNEIDKKRVAEKISAIFSLSPEESDDLVANTPIIILDNLSYDTAVKLKDYFRAVGAETILTNDVFQKRKCYRTVWPEPPNLSFLHEWNAGSAEEALKPDEAVNEIRSLAKEINEPHESPASASPAFSENRERKQLHEEVERWRKECRELQEEEKALRAEIERLRKDSSSEIEEEESAQAWSDDRDEELREVRTLLGNAEERYQTLKEEYREARTIYEEKIAHFLREGELHKKQAPEFQETLKQLQKKNEDYEIALEKKKNELIAADEASRKMRLDFEQKLLERSEEFQRLGLKWKDAVEKVELFQKAKEQIELTINEQSEKITFWREKHDALLGKLQQLERTQAAEKETREKGEARQRDFEAHQARLTQNLEEKKRELQNWELKSLEWEKQMLAQKEEAKIERENYEKKELRQREIEIQYARLIQEIEDKKKSFQGLEVRLIEQEKQIAAQKEAFEKQQLAQKEVFEKQQLFYEAMAKKLEERERELESARRQLRDVNLQMEQRETVAKRNQLAAQLVEKESYLKRLVQNQESIASEIRDREESLRRVLSEQESVEKEIMEAKQTQRHLAELAKRDKGRFRTGKETQDGVESKESSSND